MNYTLITGASSGIGLEFAHIFAQKWHNLVLVARNTQIFATIKEQYPNIEIISLQKDLSQTSAPKEIYEQLHTSWATVDILINNAGFWDFGYFHEIDIQHELAMIDLNVKALTELTYLFGKEMVWRKWGKILNVASTAAFFPGPLMSVYFASKHYVLAFSEGVAEEWAEFGVTVTALCPGPTQTWFEKSANLEQSKLFKWKKLPTAKEVALYGYSAMMQGKRIAVHGLGNKILIALTRYVPTKIWARIVKKGQEK